MHRRNFLRLSILGSAATAVLPAAKAAAKIPDPVKVTPLPVLTRHKVRLRGDVIGKTFDVPGCAYVAEPFTRIERCKFVDSPLTAVEGPFLIMDNLFKNSPITFGKGPGVFSYNVVRLLSPCA